MKNGAQLGGIGPIGIRPVLVGKKSDTEAKLCNYSLTMVTLMYFLFITRKLQQFPRTIHTILFVYNVIISKYKRSIVSCLGLYS